MGDSTDDIDSLTQELFQLRSERADHKAEALRLRALLAAVPDLIIRIHRDGTVELLFRFVATWRDDAEVQSAFLVLEALDGDDAKLSALIGTYVEESVRTMRQWETAPTAPTSTLANERALPRPEAPAPIAPANPQAGHIRPALLGIVLLVASALGVGTPFSDRTTSPRCRPARWPPSRPPSWPRWAPTSCVR